MLWPVLTMYELLRVEITEQVGRITLDRPDVRNALNDQLIEELTQALRALGDDAQARAILLSGAGQAFCAGADIRHMQRSAEFTFEQNLADAQRLAELLHLFRQIPKPIIARVHGAAIGGGLGLVAASDIALALHSAMFSLSEVRLGLVPAVISPFVLERIGMTAARRYALTAERFDGVEAQRIRLITEAVATVELLDAKIERMLNHIRQNAPVATGVCKRELVEISGTPWAALRERTARTIAELRVSEEGQEGLKAFLEKRPAKWQRD